jgi:transcriptional regulator with PAS, ATPase and Fis domain
MSGEKTDNREEMKELLREFDENPYDPSRKTPDDVMRIFYQFNVPLIPVISRRETLLGIIMKEDMTAEMSDIDRTSSCKIDEFITRVAKKRTLDELIPHVTNSHELVVINIFGEVQGRWSRVDLFAALESPTRTICNEDEISASREKQVMEWMIYTILEHIPRALYAVNAEGKTIFFNSLFEDLYNSAMKTDEVDHLNVERIIADPCLNQCTFGGEPKSDPVFYNPELGLKYEKLPMYSNGNLSGYLLYFGKSSQKASGDEGRTLSERVDFAERQIIVNEIRRFSGDITAAAKSLSVGRAALLRKIEKYGISADNKDHKPAGKGRK